MYYSHYYSHLDEKKISESIKEEGFAPLKLQDDPGFVYAPHHHPETKLLAFLEGSMSVTVEGQTFECQAGDKLIIPGGVVHSARVGSKGCCFFWSEKLL